MAEYEVGRLDENGILIAVEPCGESAYRTDAIERTVRLEPGHDMRNRIGNYRYDWHKHAFMPLSQEALELAERDTSELVEGIVETIEDITEYLKKNAPRRRTLGGSAVDESFELSRRMTRVLKEYRRAQPRRREGEE